MSATRKPKLGSFGAIQDAAVKAALNQIKEVIEANLGLRGDTLDANPTWRELVASGLVSFTRRGFNANETIINPGTGQNSPDFDSAIPPAPENVSVEDGYTAIYIGWDAPVFANLAYSEVWRSATDNLGSAVKVGQAEGSTPFYVDTVGNGSALLYYWVRFVSTWDIIGPYNAGAGTPGQSAIDPAYVNQQLSAQIGVGGPGVIVIGATNFALGMPSEDDIYPFALGLINGETVIGINAATYIIDATITDAKIGSLKADKLFVDSGTIANAIIGSADITNAMISNIIQSNNYVAGSAGWIINKAGNAEFRNIIARGDIEATTIKADAADIVKTLHLEGDAVTIPISAYVSTQTFTALAELVSFSSFSSFSGQRISYGFTTPADLGNSNKLTAFFFGYASLPNYVAARPTINAFYIDQRYAFRSFDEGSGNYLTSEGRAFIGLELYNNTDATTQTAYITEFGYGSSSNFSYSIVFNVAENKSYTLRGFFDSTNPNIDDLNQLTLFGTVTKR